MPPSLYLIFCNKLDSQKARRVPLLQVQKLPFLSLRYSADFRRSRLVTDMEFANVGHDVKRNQMVGKSKRACRANKRQKGLKEQALGAKDRFFAVLLVHFRTKKVTVFSGYCKNGSFRLISCTHC